MSFLTLLNLIITLFILVIVVTFQLGSSLPSGAPAAACLSLSPFHSSSPQPSQSSPFAVRALIKKDRNGKEVAQVMIRPRSFGQKFRGFMVQARLVKDQDVIVDGEFVPDEGELSKTFGCGEENTGMNTWTHKSASSKTRASAKWIPSPGQAEGEPILFKATIVNDKITYWENQTSEQVVFKKQPQQKPKLDQPKVEIESKNHFDELESIVAKLSSKSDDYDDDDDQSEAIATSKEGSGSKEEESEEDEGVAPNAQEVEKVEEEEEEEDEGVAPNFQEEEDKVAETIKPEVGKLALNVTVKPEVEKLEEEEEEEDEGVAAQDDDDDEEEYDEEDED